MGGKYKLILYVTALFLFVVPVHPFAQAQTLAQQIILTVKDTLNVLIGVLLVLATVVFFWGMVLFIGSSGEPSKREKAKGTMLWGLIGLAVIASAWGVTTILYRYFGIPSESPRMSPPPIFKDMFNNESNG